MEDPDEVVLLSFRHLGSFRQKKSSRNQESRNKNRNIFHLKTLRTLLHKLIPRTKLHMGNVGSHKALYSKKPENTTRRFVTENEIERFHREFIVPLENWEQASEPCGDPCDGKFPLSSPSDLDSGHFSAELTSESGSLSSSASTISTISTVRRTEGGAVCRWEWGDDEMLFWLSLLLQARTLLPLLPLPGHS